MRPGLSHKSGPVFVGEGQRPALEQPGWIERVNGTHQPGNFYRAYRL
jgi:hypothetical protein